MTESKDIHNNNNNMIIVDITVANSQIRALKPSEQFQNMLMPTNDTEKILFWNTVNTDRLNNRIYGTLKGKALKKAEKLVNENGNLSTSGEYGSLKIREDDFIPF